MQFLYFQFRSSAKETEWTEKRNVQIESQTKTGEKRREKRFACRFGLFGKTKGQRKAGQRFRKNAKNQSHFVWFGLSRRGISTISTTKEKEVIISRKNSIFYAYYFFIINTDFSTLEIPNFLYSNTFKKGSD